MREPKRLNPDMCMDDIMRRWPETIAVLIRHGMLCVGCPIAIYHTVTEACEEHGVDEDAFVGELLAAIPG